MRRTIIRKVDLQSITITFWAIATLFLTLSFDINPPGQLEAARARWKTQEIDHYRILYVFGSYDYITNGVLEVQNNVIISTGGIFNTPDVLSEQFGQWLPPDVEDYTVDGMHAYWNRKRKTHGESLVEICSDTDRYEVQYGGGILTSLQYRTAQSEPYGTGILCPRFGSHPVQVTVHIFYEVHDE